METLLQDIRFGCRLLLKNKGFTAVAVAALALGIGASTAIFSLVDTVLLRPLPYPNPGKIVYLEGVNPAKGINESNVSAPDFYDWHKSANALEHLALFATTEGILDPRNGEPVRVPRAAVTSDFFSALGVQPVLGRALRAEENKSGAPFVALLGNALWHRHFGADRRIIGQQINVGGRSMTVVGVMPKGFAYPNGDTEIWSSLQLDLAGEPRDNRSLEAIGRVKPDATLEQAQAQLSAINAQLAQQFRETNQGWDVRLIRLQDRLVRDVRPFLLTLLGAVFFLLLIACANVANLLLARAAARQREVALRAALGASRARVWRQFLTESLLLALVGGTLGVILGEWLTGSLASLTLADLPQTSVSALNLHGLLAALGLSLLTGLLFGSVPAFHASKLNLTQALNQAGRSGADSPSSHRTRNFFLVSEIALSLVLLVGAGLLIRSFDRLRNVQPGFNPKRVLTMSISLPYAKYPENAQRVQFFERLTEKVHNLPGVESAAANLCLPLNGSNYQIGRAFIREGHPATVEESVDASYSVATSDYFRTLEIPLLAGRTFTSDDNLKSPMVTIINRTLAERYFGSPQQSLGKRLTIWRDEKFPREIIGVVGDTKNPSLDAEVGPQIFVPYAQDPEWGTLSLAVRTKVEPSSLTAAVRQQVLTIDPGEPVYRVQTMEEIVRRSTATRRASMLLLGIFASSALLLAAIGIYGAMAYSVTQRTREIGIRMALGAQTSDVLWLILRQGMALALGGAFVGLVVSLFFTRIIRGLLFGVGAGDPGTYAAILFLLILVALAACYWPARRAAKLNPVKALAEN
jgi:putative ABC transport system permease protein